MRRKYLTTLPNFVDLIGYQKNLKDHSENFINPMKDMLNTSLSEGNFPNILEIAQDCTMFKKGEPYLRESYRPSTNFSLM